MRGVGSLDKIQIKNIRSLKDTGQVALSPITLLVGENSSGKSTFLRLFPLIKQSISKRTDGPLLWAGDVDDYVDFGSFAETITNDGSTAMTLGFSFPISKSVTYLTYRETRISRSFPKLKELMNKIPDQTNIQYSITISQDNGHEYISRLEVRLDRSQFEFLLHPPGKRSPGGETICVDTKQISYDPDMKRERPLHYGVEFVASEIFGYALPTLSGVLDKLMQELFGGVPADIDEDGFVLRHYHDYPISLMQLIGQYLCLGTTWEEIRTVLTEKKQKEFDITERFLQRLILCLSELPEKRLQEILSAFKLLFFYSFFSEIEEYLKIYFRQVHYIAPLRATAERYYRLRNLAIDEVDYQGKNLAMFLSGLSEARMRKFQSWTQEYFGFRVIVDKKGGHLSVKIALTDGGDPVNMSDTGFGYSQILPIITQLWDLSTNSRPTQSRREKVPLVIAIEQPELHLHPALQAKLAKALLSSIQLAKENGYHLQLIIETHSETIVNYFGMAIANGALQKQDVSVVLFDKNLQTKHTQVQSSSYDQDGFLLDWPIGFFAPKEW